MAWQISEDLPKLSERYTEEGEERRRLKAAHGHRGDRDSRVEGGTQGLAVSPGLWPCDGQEGPQNARAPLRCEQIAWLPLDNHLRELWGGGTERVPYGQGEAGGRERQSENVKRVAWGGCQENQERQGDTGDTRASRHACGREPTPCTLPAHRRQDSPLREPHAHRQTSDREHSAPDTQTYQWAKWVSAETPANHPSSLVLAWSPQTGWKHVNTAWF